MLLLNIYYVAGTGEPAVNKTEKKKKKNPHPLDLHIVEEERDSKETNL